MLTKTILVTSMGWQYIALKTKIQVHTKYTFLTRDRNIYTLLSELFQPADWNIRGYRRSAYKFEDLFEDFEYLMKKYSPLHWLLLQSVHTLRIPKERFMKSRRKRQNYRIDDGRLILYYTFKRRIWNICFPTCILQVPIGLLPSLRTVATWQ